MENMKAKGRLGHCGAGKELGAQIRGHRSLQEGKKLEEKRGIIHDIWKLNEPLTKEEKIT